MKNWAKNSTLWILALVVGASGLSASGQIGKPQEIRAISSKGSGAPQAAAKKDSVFAQLRPVDQGNNYIPNMRMESKTTLEKVFDKDFMKNMKARYDGSVAIQEQIVTSPYRFARPWEQERYNQSRKDMARWTAKEVLDDQLRDFFAGADKDSDQMKMVNAVKSVTTADFGDKEEKKPLTPAEKAAQAHRLDLPQQQEEESIPTRLKTRFNVVQQRGQLHFSNPIAVANVNLDMRSDDNVSFDLKREFKKLKMSSNARYGAQKKVLTFNVNKVITNRISLDLNSDNYTGNQKGAAGEQSNESAKVTYSLSF